MLTHQPNGPMNKYSLSPQNILFHHQPWPSLDIPSTVPATALTTPVRAPRSKKLPDTTQRHGENSIGKIIQPKSKYAPNRTIFPHSIGSVNT